MGELTINRFPEFFSAVRGYEPFLWQFDLVQQLLDGHVPGLIDVPTGLGKTAIIDCWAYALAVQSQRNRRTVPLRAAFVVDRRLVVDGAYDEARQLAAAIETPTAAVLQDVARALRSFHGVPAVPALDVVRMRGGVTWESRWLARPDQAAVVVGTVDQFGSRFLFRGYGASDAMRPIDAALLGLDCWLVVDEAHIAQALIQTTERAARHQERIEVRNALRPLRVTRMSATNLPSSERFRARFEDPAASPRFPQSAAVAERRLHASKPVALVELTYLAAGTQRDWSSRARELGSALARLARAGSGQVVGIVVNTIATAREAHRALEREGETAILLIGRARGYERERVLSEWVPRVKVGAPAPAGQRLFVVATQTIEVGANLDFDAMVTECAPLASLIQRFGRVNRMGDRRPHVSAIVYAGALHNPDLVYGEATRATWDHLRRSGGPLTEIADAASAGDAIQPAAALNFRWLDARELAEHAPAEVLENPGFVPFLLGAHLERLALTSPGPFPDQPVGPFLHGVDRDVPEVAVAWRAAPPWGDDPAAWRSWLDLAPPLEWEFVSVPIAELRKLVANARVDYPVSDIEGARSADSEPEGRPAIGTGTAVELLGVIERGQDEMPVPVTSVADLEVLRPGDHVVLKSTVGGHDRWGWTGTRSVLGDPPVPDVADLAPTRRRGIVRLVPAVFGTWLGETDVAAAFAELDPADIPGSVPLVLQRLASMSLPAPLHDLVVRATPWRIDALRDDDGSLAAVVLNEPSAPGRATGDANSDDDVASTSQTSRPVPLARHGDDVAQTARAFAEHVGLPAPLALAVELAGRWHDLGKADPRFQVMLHDGDALAARSAPEPLAKSGRDARDPVARRARQLAGLPPGFRHEAVSARLFDELVRLAPERVTAVDADLVRHLVVSHHGKARPLLPPVLDPDAPRVELILDGIALAVDGAASQVDWKQPARFEALCERYGWWGLAYLEAIVRLADMFCSEGGP